MCPNSPALGILAGRGALPRRIAEARAAAGAPYLVIALDGFAEDWAADHPHVRAPITAVGAILAALREAGCRQVVMAGGVARPRLDPRALDGAALRWLPRLLPALARGDDALLRTVRGLLEAEGLTLVPADEVIDLRAGAGVLGACAPGARDAADAARGEAVLAALAALDVGQAAVVASGRVLGIETVQGTDALLDFVARTRDALGQGADGGVLVKRAKAGQDPAMDAPAIGPGTVRAAARAGLRGIALEAGAVQVIDLGEAVAAADAAGLFLWGRP